ncbi:MAG: glycosyltransferase family 4 protein [Anaerolineales bacterium]|nr:glycosyltransferase family 4 protein [Anaerolineales bacterium]
MSFKQKLGVRYMVDGIGDLAAALIAQFSSADLSIFHEFEPPPAGGGHQFLRAFMRQAQARSLRIENNTISHTTRACLFNSFNFKEQRLSRMKRDSVLYVHRVDGPVDVYRGWDGGVDRHIYEVNQKFADKTIFQSNYSLEKHLELGMEFRSPVVIMNAADPEIFHPRGRVDFSRERKIRLIAASWSSNVNKGAPVYQWLDENLNWERFEFTFVGSSPIRFRNIRMIPPLDSYKLADLMREHDIYITASKNDPCSNSLIEALSCGLPAIHLQSGGHPEIVKQAGAGFEAAEQIPGLLSQVVDGYESFQSSISLPSIEDVSERYLKILELL